MRLNRTPDPLDRSARNDENENWSIIEGETSKLNNKLERETSNLNNKVDDFITGISNEAFQQVIDNIKMMWREPVDSVNDLPSDDPSGTVRMVRDTGKIYRFQGGKWDEIQDIDPSAINELDNRLTSQLADIDEFQSFNSSAISRWQNLGQPMITIHDDDGHRGVYTKLFEVAKEYGIPITSAMITNRPMGFPGDDRPYNSTYYHYDEVMEMKESGLVEFISHTHNHILNLDDEPRELIRTELTLSRDFMRRWGFNYRGVVVPGGHINLRVIEEARQVYEYMTTYGGTNRIVKPPFSNYEIPRASLDQDIESIKMLIDEAYENNAWIILRTHVDQASSYSNEKFREIIEYAQTKNFKFVTTEEGFRHHGNLMEVSRNELISSDGKIFGNRLGRTVIDKSTEIDNNTPISYFEPNTVTHSIIRSAQSAGFPTQFGRNSGLLVTHRMSEVEDFWNYQTFVPNGNNEQYIRYWVTSESFDNDPAQDKVGYPKWSEWKSLTGTSILKDNAVSINTPPEEFPLNITVTRISSDNVIGFPGNRGGILITHRHSNLSNGWTYQEYLVYNSSRRYYRNQGSGRGTWTGWKPRVSHESTLTQSISVTINALDTYERLINTSSITDNEIVTARPTTGNIPKGLVWNVFVVEEGTIILRITNVTDSNISMASTRWEIQRLSY